MRSWTKTTLVLAAVFVLPPFLASQATGQAPTPAAPRPSSCYDRLPTDPINLSLRDASTQSTLRLLAQNYKVTIKVAGLAEAKYYEKGTRAAGNADPPNVQGDMGTDTFYTGGNPVDQEDPIQIAP